MCLSSTTASGAAGLQQQPVGEATVSSMTNSATNGSRSRPRRRRSERLRGDFADVSRQVVAGILIAVVVGAAGVVWSFLHHAAPLSVSVVLQPNGSWIVPRPPDAIRFPNIDAQDESAWLRWARSQGGGEANSTVVRIAVDGRRAAAVRLEELVIEVRRRRRAPQGTRVLLTAGGGIARRLFETNLDDEHPLATPVTGQGPSAEHVTFPMKVSEGDPEEFLLEATTQRCDCEWVAKLKWELGDQHGTEVIDNGGEPFRTIGSAKARSVAIAGHHFEALDDGS